LKEQGAGYQSRVAVYHRQQMDRMSRGRIEAVVL
jgi:hypothetical protein